MFRVLCLAVLSGWAFAIDAQSLRDPTQPVGSVDREREVSLQLHSVLSSKARRVAVINGVMVREGDTIPGADGALVERIGQGYVIIVREGETIRLGISPGEGIAPAKGDDNTTNR